MKKLNTIVWGIVLVAIGLLLALNAFGVTNFELFFDGWWTLFIIIPCAVGLFSGNDATGNLIGLLIGVFLLLSCQDVIDFDVLWKLVLPVIIIIIGIKLIFGSIFSSRTFRMMEQTRVNGGAVRTATATFSGVTMDCAGEVFNGAEMNAIFGSVKCDLRNAIIPRDCVINATAVFGGVDIYLPDTVNVKIRSNSLFGGVSNKRAQNGQPNGITIYINGSGVFGGVDIR